MKEFNKLIKPHAVSLCALALMATGLMLVIRLIGG